MMTSRLPSFIPLLLFAVCFLSVLLLSIVTYAQQNERQQVPYVKVPAGYLMVLQKNDDVFAALEAFAVNEKVPSATITAIGYVNATFGFFDSDSKTYKPKTFNNMELASMTGSIAWENQKPSLHVHGVATDHDFNARGGHLLAATVGTGSLELTIFVHDKKLERREDASLGAKVLQIR